MGCDVTFPEASCTQENSNSCLAFHDKWHDRHTNQYEWYAWFMIYMTYIYIWWHCYMHQVPWNYLLHSMVFNLMLNFSGVTIHYMILYHVKWYTGPQKEMQTEQTEPFWHTVKFLSILIWCNLLPVKTKSSPMRQKPIIWSSHRPGVWEEHINMQVSAGSPWQPRTLRKAWRNASPLTITETSYKEIVDYHDYIMITHTPLRRIAKKNTLRKINVPLANSGWETSFLLGFRLFPAVFVVSFWQKQTGIPCE